MFSDGRATCLSPSLSIVHLDIKSAVKKVKFIVSGESGQLRL